MYGELNVIWCLERRGKLGNPATWDRDFLPRAHSIPITISLVACALGHGIVQKSSFSSKSRTVHAWIVIISVKGGSQDYSRGVGKIITLSLWPWGDSRRALKFAVGKDHPLAVVAPLSRAAGSSRLGSLLRAPYS